MKAPGIHHFPSRGWLDAAVRRCCPSKVVTPRCTPSALSLISGAFIQVAKILELAYGSNSDACYAAFLRSLTETLRGLNSCICVETSSFLKTAVLHHFPSGGWEWGYRKRAAPGEVQPF